MAEYVLVWCSKIDNSVDALVVLKEKPAWQKGRLNLLGGKIEIGETPEKAAVRELQEESGYEAYGTPVIMGRIVDGDAVVHCVRIFVMSDLPPTPRPEETEQVSWMPWTDFISDARLIPNLRVIAPLILCGVKGWKITDTFSSSESAVHSFSVEVPTRY